MKRKYYAGQIGDDWAVFATPDMSRGKPLTPGESGNLRRMDDEHSTQL